MGTKTLSDYLTSVAQLAKAKQSLSHARYDYLLQKVKLKQSIGALGDKDIEQLQKLLVKQATLEHK